MTISTETSESSLDICSADDRLARARLSLEGLSVGDAFGQRFFTRPELALSMIEARALPKKPWCFTDDTEMALAIYQILDRDKGLLSQQELAQAFAHRFGMDPNRGYGGGAMELLEEIRHGADWRDQSRALFGGSGSYGNGGAMRVAPLGAYFADDISLCVSEARKSAEVTHAHAEGQAGAIAVAVAAAWAFAQRQECNPQVSGLFDLVFNHTPEGLTREGIAAARALPLDAAIDRAATELGSGSAVSAMDTVPFCIWSIARNPKDFEQAMWETVAGLGDRDTTCAIVGGVVALSATIDSIPQEWIRSREHLPL